MIVDDTHSRITPLKTFIVSVSLERETRLQETRETSVSSCTQTEPLAPVIKDSADKSRLYIRLKKHSIKTAIGRTVILAHLQFCVWLLRILQFLKIFCIIRKPDIRALMFGYDFHTSATGALKYHLGRQHTRFRNRLRLESERDQRREKSIESSSSGDQIKIVKPGKKFKYIIHQDYYLL